MNFLIRITILAILLPTQSFATDKLKCDGHEEPENTSAVEMICHDLSHLLPQELQALQSGMMSVIPAYVSGNWGEIGATAAKMKKCVSLAGSSSRAPPTCRKLRRIKGLAPLPETLVNRRLYSTNAGNCSI